MIRVLALLAFCAVAGCDVFVPADIPPQVQVFESRPSLEVPARSASGSRSG